MGKILSSPAALFSGGMEAPGAGEEIRTPDQEEGSFHCPAIPDNPGLDPRSSGNTAAPSLGARLQTGHFSAELCSGCQQILSPTWPGLPCFRGIRISWEVCKTRHAGLLCGVSDPEGVGRCLRICMSRKSQVIRGSVQSEPQGTGRKGHYGYN